MFDTTPISAIAQQCLDMVALYGKLMLYSSFHPDNPISVSPNTVHRSLISICGSANSNSSDFMKAIDLFNHKIIDPSVVTSDIVTFEKVKEAMKEAIDPSTYRIIIKF